MKSDDKAGLYITVIFHLMVIIVLLVSQISSALKRENTFVLDFSKQERVEKEQAERNLKEEVSERLDRMLAASILPKPFIRVTYTLEDAKRHALSDHCPVGVALRVQ